MIYLSTQADEEPAGVFKSRLDYARSVRDGKISAPRFLPVIYEFPQSVLDKQGQHDPDNWYMTNPNLGVSVSEEFLRDKYAQAKEAGEGVLRVASSSWSGSAQQHSNPAGDLPRSA